MKDRKKVIYFPKMQKTVVSKSQEQLENEVQWLHEMPTPKRLLYVLGNKIRERRESLNISTEEVNGKHGYVYDINCIEEGLSSTPLEVYLKILAMLGKTLKIVDLDTDGIEDIPVLEAVKIKNKNNKSEVK